MFKKKSILVLLLLLMMVFVTGRGLVEAESNFLWQVENIESDVYLMGSFHLLPEGHYPLDETIENAFAESEYLVVEANVLDVDQAEIEAIEYETGFYSGGERLSDNIDPELFQTAKEKVEIFGVTEEVLEQLRPWYVSLLIAQLQLNELDFTVEEGVETYFLNKANEQGKEILELESVAEQLYMLAGLSPEVQRIALEAELEELEDFDGQELHDMVAAWSEGDKERLEELMFSVRDENPELEEYYEVVFDQRDIEMTDKIEELIEEGKDVFVVVGAGHLANKNGILALLEERDYELKQL